MKQMPTMKVFTFLVKFVVDEGAYGAVVDVLVYRTFLLLFRHRDHVTTAPILSSLQIALLSSIYFPVYANSDGGSSGTTNLYFFSISFLIDPTAYVNML